MKILALAAAAAAALASPALAQDRGWDISGEVGAATDYVSKGVSKTNGDPQVFAGWTAARGDFYVTPWVSNADFGPGADAEVKLTAGWAPEAWGYEWDWAVIGKAYPGTVAGEDDTMVEVQGAVRRAIGPADLRLLVNYTPDNYGAAEDAWWWEGAAAWKLSSKAKIGGALGWRGQDGGNDYYAWNAGVLYKLTDRLSADVRYYDTDGHEFGDNYESRVVGALKLSL